MSKRKYQANLDKVLGFQCLTSEKYRIKIIQVISNNFSFFLTESQQPSVLKAPQCNIDNKICLIFLCSQYCSMNYLMVLSISQYIDSDSYKDAQQANSMNQELVKQANMNQYCVKGCRIDQKIICSKYSDIKWLINELLLTQAFVLYFIILQTKNKPRIICIVMLSQSQKSELTSLTDSLSSLMVSGSQSSQQKKIPKPSTLFTAPLMPWNLQDTYQQFNTFYRSRLSKFSVKFPQIADSQKLVTISVVDAEVGKPVYVIGILKKVSAKRIRYFDKQYQQTMSQNGNRGNQKLVSEDDLLQIQDNTGKIKITLHQKATLNGKQVIAVNLPYGVVVGLAGRYHKKTDRLIVSEIILPKFTQPQKALKTSIHKKSSVAPELPWKILFMSQPSYQQIVLLKEIVHGKRSCNFSQINYQIQSVVILGGMRMKDPTQVKQFDKILSQLSKSVAVSVLPSALTSKSSYIYPQSKHDNIYYPCSGNKIVLASNPQLFNEQSTGLEILVSSGENVRDFWRNSNTAEIDEPTKIMHQMLLYCHLCPTAPFSIKSQSYKQDFLVLERPPHIFIAGDCDITGVKTEIVQIQSSLEKGSKQQVLLVGVGNGCIALLDIKNKNATDLSLKSW